MKENELYFPIVCRSDVEEKKYPEYRENLRNDFLYSCAYCSIMEYESHAIRFEIEHYLPQKKFPELKHNYDNLMWSCEKCNNSKNDYVPDELAVQKDNVVIKIDEEDPRQHLDLSGQRMVAKNHKGEFNIALLRLNRLTLRRLREIRERFWKSKENIAHGIQVISKRISLDRAHKDDRFKILKTKKSLIERGKDFEGKELECIFKEFAHSPLIDRDPDKKEQMKERKKYLKDQKAIIRK